MPIRSKLYLAVVALAFGIAGLAACTMKAEITSRPVAEKGQPMAPVISEFCYDGYVYLINPQGGMSPKVRGADAGDMLTTRCENQ